MRVSIMEGSDPEVDLINFCNKFYIKCYSNFLIFIDPGSTDKYIKIVGWMYCLRFQLQFLYLFVLISNDYCHLYGPSLDRI